ncbi:MAG: hypothetical protein L3J88_14300 [Gammaproteobacteria bacterium]|nr:hypothetical protein [Gammaproteobacteria bacterium]MCF6364484.1 hypothetical protein [Gammaproteobacteria bacterium]
MKELLTILLVGGFGIGGLVFVILFPILYFRLTGKYDAIFPNHADLTDARGIQGEINRTGRYMWCIVRKTLSQRNERIRKVTGGYDFRGNAPVSEIILCYLILFSGFIFISSAFTFFFLTKILGIDL